MNKTISEWNSKIWYRLLKVIYCISLIVTLLMCVLIFSNSYDEYIEIDKDKTTITCNSIYKTFSPREMNINLKYSRFNRSYINSSVVNSTIKMFCKKKMLEKKTGYIPSNLDDIRINIVPVLQYKYLIFWLITSFILILFAFEISRRLFYYIAIGDFNPKK